MSEMWNKFVHFVSGYSCLEAAVERIRATNNLIAIETSKILDDHEICIRPLHSLSDEEYKYNVRTESDPETRVDFLSRVIGLFVSPNQIFVDTRINPHEIERTIVHEVQHYRNACTDPDITDHEDEMLAIAAEDRYSGRYITRLYMRQLREYVEAIFLARKN